MCHPIGTRLPTAHGAILEAGPLWLLWFMTIVKYKKKEELSIVDSRVYDDCRHAKEVVRFHEYCGSENQITAIDRSVSARLFRACNTYE
jgi:hypothetical protein